MRTWTYKKWEVGLTCPNTQVQQEAQIIRDFDYLAKDLVTANEKKGKRCIVANIDVLGRGDSDWLDANLYSYATVCTPAIQQLISRSMHPW